MRLPNGLIAGVVGLLATGLTGCTGSGPAQAPYPGSAPAAAGTTSAFPAASESTQAQAGPAEPETKAGARAAAARFYRLYSSGQFAASWVLLSPTTQRAVPRGLWVSVHERCPTPGAGAGRVIKSVLVFGNAAIVTGAVSGAGSRLGRSHDVFNYTDGHWGYTPNDLNIYHHGSVAADIAAAKAQGFCTLQEAAPL
jgi:hypothetical protein